VEVRVGRRPGHHNRPNRPHPRVAPRSGTDCDGLAVGSPRLGRLSRLHRPAGLGRPDRNLATHQPAGRAPILPAGSTPLTNRHNGGNHRRFHAHRRDPGDLGEWWRSGADDVQAITIARFDGSAARLPGRGPVVMAWRSRPRGWGRSGRILRRAAAGTLGRGLLPRRGWGARAGSSAAPGLGVLGLELPLRSRWRWMLAAHSPVAKALVLRRMLATGQPLRRGRSTVLSRWSPGLG
jgi:hypothetical protein